MFDGSRRIWYTEEQTNRSGREYAMQYRTDRKGTKLSVLGYGCLRFTKKNGKIDLDKTKEEIMEAIRGGVNYFDTA